MPTRERALALALAALFAPRGDARAQGAPAAPACVSEDVIRALACAPAPARATAPATAPAPAAPSSVAPYELTQTAAWDARIAPDPRWHREPFDPAASAQQLAAVPSTSPSYPRARYALAAVAFLAGRHDDAARAAQDALASARANPTWPDASELREASLRAFVLAYGATDPAPDAVASLAALRAVADSDDHALELLEALARRYAQRGAWGPSAASYRALAIARPASPRRCRWQYELARAATSEQLSSGLAEVARLVDLQAAWDAPDGTPRPEAERASCRALAAGLVFELASSLDGVSLSDAPLAGRHSFSVPRAADLAAAADLYGALLARFPALDATAFPALPRAAWPTRYLAAWRRANALRAAENFSACGPAYDEVADLEPAGRFTSDALYLSMLCYNDTLARQLSAQPRRAPRRRADAPDAYAPTALTPFAASMERSFARFVCRSPSLPASGEALSGGARDVLLTAEFRRAHLYYEAQHFDAAAHLFREVAFSDPAVPDPENLREIAADLMLDSVNVLATRGPDGAPRPACHDALAEGVLSARERFCAEAVRGLHEDFCRRADALQCGVLRRRAEGLYVARRFAAAGRAYVAAQRDPACAGDASARHDELLYNAAVAFDATPLPARAVGARRALVELGLPRDSAFAMRAAYALGGDYEALHLLAESAAYYELFGTYVVIRTDAARRAEEDAVAKAAFALQRARDLRRALGDEGRAGEDERMLARLRAADRPGASPVPVAAPAPATGPSPSPLDELAPAASYVRSRPAESAPAWEPRSLAEGPPDEGDPSDYVVPLGPPAVHLGPSARPATPRSARAFVVHRIRTPIVRPAPSYAGPPGFVEYAFEPERVTAAEPAHMPPVFARGVSPHAVRSVVRERLGEVRACYTALLRVSPRAEGRLVLRFVVGHDGRVTAATTLPTAARSAVEAIVPCVLGVARAMRFEPSAAPFTVTADYPIEFAPAAP